MFENVIDLPSIPVCNNYFNNKKFWGSHYSTIFSSDVLLRLNLLTCLTVSMAMSVVDRVATAVVHSEEDECLACLPFGRHQ